MSPMKLKLWKESALNDGWMQVQEHIVAGNKDRKRIVHYTLEKEGYVAWLSMNSSVYNFKITNPQGSRFELERDIQQEDGYNWQNIIALSHVCSNCLQIQNRGVIIYPITGCPICTNNMRNE